MEELTNLDLLEITNLNPKEYLLTMKVNGKKRDFTVWIEMTEPFFGVNFSDDFIYISRNYRSDIQQLVEIVEKHYHAKKTYFPVSLLIEKNVPELQAV